MKQVVTVATTALKSKHALWVGLLCVLLPGATLGLLLLLGGGAVVSGAPDYLHQVVDTTDVPPPIMQIVQHEAQQYGIDPYYYAAYIKVQTKNTWDIAVPTIRQMLIAHRGYNTELRENPCHPQSAHPVSDQERPERCAHYTVPPDEPTDRTTLEAAWRQQAQQRLDTWLCFLFEVPRPELLPDRPEPRDIQTRIKQRKEADVWDNIQQWAEMYSTFYTDLQKDPDAREVTDNEDAALQIFTRDWEYLFPVPDPKAVFTNDWGAARPQNDSFGVVAHHQGTDIFSAPGTPLLAVTDGTIWKAGWDPLGGWTVYIEDGHTHFLWYYAHMMDPSPLHQGQVVHRGDQVGRLGSTGEGPEGHDGGFQPHLHFGLYLDPSGIVTNPYPYLLEWFNHPPDAPKCPNGVC